MLLVLLSAQSLGIFFPFEAFLLLSYFLLFKASRMAVFYLRSLLTAYTRHIGPWLCSPFKAYLLLFITSFLKFAT
jgi:hypothetical protein